MSKVRTAVWSALFAVGMVLVAFKDTILGLLGLKKEVPEEAVAKVEEAVAKVDAAQEQRAVELQEKVDAVEEKAAERKEADPVAVGNEIVAKRRGRKPANAATADSAPGRTRKTRKS